MQCEYITSVGQCSRDAVPPGRFCADHSPAAGTILVNQYRIACAPLGDAPLRHATDPAIKSLTGEITVLRSLLETRLRMVKNDAELQAATPAISALAGQIEKLISSLHAMDVKLGNLLSKGALIELAQQIIGIIDTNLRSLVGTSVSSDDIDAIIEQIAAQMMGSIAEQENTGDKNGR